MLIGEAAKHILDLVTADVIDVELYTNDYTPTDTDQVDGSDYITSALGVQSLSAFPPGDVAPGKSEATHGDLTWNPGPGSSGVVYGVVLKWASDGDLVCGIRFSTPKAVAEGVPIVVQVKAICQRLGYGS